MTRPRFYVASDASNDVILVDAEKNVGYGFAVFVLGGVDGLQKLADEANVDPSKIERVHYSLPLEEYGPISYLEVLDWETPVPGAILRDHKRGVDFPFSVPDLAFVSARQILAAETVAESVGLTYDPDHLVGVELGFVERELPTLGAPRERSWIK